MSIIDVARAAARRRAVHFLRLRAGWEIATRFLVGLAAAACLTTAGPAVAQARVQGLSEGEATAAVEFFTDILAETGPDFATADALARSRGYTPEDDRWVNGRYVIFATQQEDGASAALMTLIVQDWYGLIGVFEGAMSVRFGGSFTVIDNERSPAQYAANVDGVRLAIYVIPSEREGFKVVQFAASNL